MDGGGYYALLHTDPPQAPIGYKLKLYNKVLFNPERTTSFCSGSSFAAFIEGMNLIYPDSTISPSQTELVRMQEPDGGRREDHIKFWGEWNADGYGNDFALVQYTKIGERIKPEEARPGDFMNISWKSGLGHSVIFLGWYKDENGKKYVMYWSSQKGTNGLGDQMSLLSSIKELLIVRVTHPERIFNFVPPEKRDYDIKGDEINW